MRKIMILILIGFLIHGCKSYVQVLGTSAPKVKVEDGLYVLENDSLKITYNFWTQRGLMSFAIYNKLDKPLYIDWKKSSYINNSVKLDYWVEEEQEKSSEYYGSYYYDGPLLRPGYAVSNIGGVSASSTKRVERITIIPPASNYYQTQFYILPKSFFKLDTQADFKDVPRHDKPKKNTKVYDQSYLKENSPLVFRNFLTFSFSEDFNKEFYFDNEFYVSEIKEMEKRNFEYYKRDSHKAGKFYLQDKNGNVLNFSDYKKESSFFVYIPKEISIDKRK